MRSLGSCQVTFQDVFVPDENVIGEVGQGWRLLSETLNSERIMVAAQCYGALQGILDDMLAYATDRTAFTKPLGQFQAVQHMIANAAMGLEAARLLTYRAAWLQYNGRPCGVEATTAEVMASEACVQAADDGIQILGATATRSSTTCSATGATCGSTGSPRSTTRWAQLHRREPGAPALVLKRQEPARGTSPATPRITKSVQASATLSGVPS